MIIRYADDLVVLHRDREVIEQAKQVLIEWLATMGLELKDSKTRYTHTLDQCEGNTGFDFLGCTVRQYTVGKTHARKTRGRTHGRIPFVTLIQPSKTAQERHYQALIMNKLLWGWAKRRHRKKSAHWIKQRYWQPDGTRYTFATWDRLDLFYHADTAIEEHVKVSGTRSPFDGDWVYWGKRLGHYPDLTKRQARLLKRQQGKCTYCGLYFISEDVLEIDHIVPPRYGGRDEYTNWQLLHRHCHDAKTAYDHKIYERGTDDNSQVVEEPCEVKVSRTVLKTSRMGDCPA